MSSEIEHSDMTKKLLHQTFHYQQATDPGAVGAGKWWLDTTLVEVLPDTFGYQLKYRNDANTDWVTL